MKSYKFIVRLNWMLLLVLAVTIASCSDDDVSDEVKLEVFGPTPVARGGELTFIGRNLDKVSAVLLPDDIEITDIDVVSSEEIVITVPQEANAGKVTLVYPGGTVVSRSNLGFIEPVAIETITPAVLKAGQTLTITGEYLNLVYDIVFAERDTVRSADYLVWERGKIELVLPKEVKSGSIMLLDSTQSTILKSEETIEVVLPSVTELTSFTNQKPGDELSVEVNDIDLVAKVIVPSIGEVDFTINGGSVTFSLPDSTTNGTINVRSFSDLEVAVAELSMAVATNLVATPATDLLAGDEIIITGSDLELVTGILFTGVSDVLEPVFNVNGEIVLTLPVSAMSGDIALQTASGNTSYVAINTLKPVVSSYNPSTVAAGDVLTINGTNLNLVKAVTFSNGLEVEVTPVSETEMSVKVPFEALSGAFTLTMKNGEVVTVQDLSIIEATFCYVTVLPSYAVSGELTGFNVVNGEALTDAYVNDQAVQFILQGTTLYLPMALGLEGETTIKLVSPTREVSYQINVVSGAVTIWEGEQILGEWVGYVQLSGDLFSNAKVGQILRVYVKDLDSSVDSWKVVLKENTDGWPDIEGIDLASGDTFVEFSFTQELLSSIEAGSGLNIAGKMCTVTKVEIE